jgi:hypothetical protein
MVAIRVVLVAAFGLLLVGFLQSRNAASIRAVKKVLLVGLVVFAIVVVLQPGIADGLANILGVGRGADLLLYSVTVAFLFVSLNGYLKFLEMESRFAALVRAVALLEERNQPPVEETE